jgi:HPt (histidine-containing phosphotransfer) domain-containing protein
MIDRVSLLQRCGEDRELLRELLEDFLGRCDSEVESLTLEDKNLHRRAHRLKGLALNLSMPEVEARAARVERSAREGSVDEVELQALRESLQAASASARSILQEEENA